MNMPAEGQSIKFADTGNPAGYGITVGQRYRVHLRKNDILLSTDDGRSFAIQNSEFGKLSWTPAQ